MNDDRFVSLIEKNRKDIKKNLARFLQDSLPLIQVNEMTTKEKLFDLIELQKDLERNDLNTVLKRYIKQEYDSYMGHIKPVDGSDEEMTCLPAVFIMDMVKILALYCSLLNKEGEKMHEIYKFY